MRRSILTSLALLFGVLAGCGDEEDSDFVTWATEQGGLDQTEAKCVEAVLTEDEREALIRIQEDTAEEEIDETAVDALVAASLEC